jgi:hypothetical protein
VRQLIEKIVERGNLVIPFDHDGDGSEPCDDMGVKVPYASADRLVMGVD